MRRIHWIAACVVLGIAILLVGQWLAQPNFYGTAIYSAHAHIMVFGLLLCLGSLTAELIWCIATSKNRIIRQAGIYQLWLIVGATVLATLNRLTTKTIDHFSLQEGQTTTLPDPGDANLGAFVLWLLVLFVGTMCNLCFLAIRGPATHKRTAPK